MNEGLIILDKSINVIAANNRARTFLDTEDGMGTCGNKLRLEDKLAFSTLLNSIYSDDCSSDQKEWYASRPSKYLRYRLKLFALSEPDFISQTPDLYSLLIVSESCAESSDRIC